MQTAAARPASGARFDQIVDGGAEQLLGAERSKSYLLCAAPRHARSCRTPGFRSNELSSSAEAQEQSAQRTAP
jgi:hypothetical protein